MSELKELGEQTSTTEMPKPTKSDAEYLALKAAIGSIPYVGGALAEVFAAQVPSPLSKKTAAWWEDLGKRVEALEKAGADLNALASNEDFFEVVKHAADLANQTTKQEKLEALRNAILNAATGIDIEADERQVFFQLVEQLTISQLKMLEFLDGPRAYGQAHNIHYGNYSFAGVDTILEEAFPEWRGKRDVYDLVLKDLQTRGLVTGDVNGIHGLMTASDQGMFARRTTSRGHRFLVFIRER